jgi:hypothetical protein
VPFITGGSSGGGGGTPSDPGTNKVWGSNGAGSALGVLPPGFEIGYDQITADVAVASTTEATGTTIITCAAHTFDGAAVVAEFFTSAVQTGTTAGNFVQACLFEGATEIARLFAVVTPVSVALVVGQTAKVRFTPTVGAHTYTVTAFIGAGTSGSPKIEAGAGGTAVQPPAFIRFTKV